MISGFVSEIQRYSVHYGPGIRTTVFLNGCSLDCAWCPNPESQKIPPWIAVNLEKCVGCGRCVAVCPNEANHLTDSGQIQLNRDICDRCGRCAEACPEEAWMTSGRVMTVKQVVEAVLKDVAFYQSSGGGVTLSGGEAALQTEFAASILEECQKLGARTTLETHGNLLWSKLEPVIRHADLVLFNLKHIDPIPHKQGTGCDIAPIFENAKRVSQVTKMKIRVVLVPGFNDSPQTIKKIARNARMKLSDGVEVELIRHGTLIQDKYERLGLASGAFEVLQSEDKLEELKAMVDQELARPRLHVVSAKPEAMGDRL